MELPRYSGTNLRSSATSPHLQADLADPPNLTYTLQRDKKIIGRGSFGIVYSCFCTRNGKVAVKAFTLPDGISQTEKNKFVRKMRRELGIWRRLDHPNIVPCLGTARGEDFASDYTCIVATWMPHGTLFQYVNRSGTTLSIPSRIQLIKGILSGLEYLHSQPIVHGDFHPGNILIDSDYNPRITDFGLSQTLRPTEGSDQLSYLWTDTIRPGAFAWTAPELLYPKLYPSLQVEPSLSSDIYSFGSITLFILSGKIPWNRTEAETRLKEFQNPPRPPWPVNIPDAVWSFMEKCWSPRLPGNRPPAQAALSFCRDELEQLFLSQPEPVLTSAINVVLFGPLGCGKSSIINLLSDEPIAEVSSGVDPCTKRPQWYQIPFGGRQLRLYDTMGFRLAQGGDSNLLLPYEQAHAVLRNITDGVHIILLCARKDGIFSSLGGLYWLINEFFHGGRAPVAFVLTHFDAPDEGWWERNQDVVAEKTGIPVRSIPHACITTLQSGRDESKQTMRALLEKYANIVPPISLRLDFPSCMTTHPFDLANNCGLHLSDSTALMKQFSHWQENRRCNVVLFGEAGVGKSSVINLVAGEEVATTSAGIKFCTLDYCAHEINTGMQQFLIWDTMGFNLHIDYSGSNKAIESAVRLVRTLSSQGGIDLLVFCRRGGRLSQSELSMYRLVEEFLCEGQVPVAVVITHLESEDPMERWWEANGKDLVKFLGKDVIGHACITSAPLRYLDDHRHRGKLMQSSLAVRAMLEDCIPPRSTLTGGYSIRRSTKRNGEMGPTTRRMMTPRNLMKRCGLSEAQAEELIEMYYE